MKTIDLLKKIETTGVITESEIHLLKLRLDKGEKIDLQFIYDSEIELTPEQSEKGWKWLNDLYKTPTGKERSRHTFGYREIEVLEDPEHIFYFRGFYMDRYTHIPIYLACGAGTSFEYYNNGRIQIIG